MSDSPWQCFSFIWFLTLSCENPQNILEILWKIREVKSPFKMADIRKHLLNQEYKSYMIEQLGKALTIDAFIDAILSSSEFKAASFSLVSI